MYNGGQCVLICAIVNLIIVWHPALFVQLNTLLSVIRFNWHNSITKTATTASINTSHTHHSLSMPPKRTRQSKEATRAPNHPYKLRSLTNPSSLENAARDRPAEKLKHNKALREQALQVFGKKELRKFPVEQLRRLATVRWSWS